MKHLQKEYTVFILNTQHTTHHTQHTLHLKHTGPSQIEGLAMHVAVYAGFAGLPAHCLQQ